MGRKKKKKELTADLSSNENFGKNLDESDFKEEKTDKDLIENKDECCKNDPLKQILSLFKVSVVILIVIAVCLILITSVFVLNNKQLVGNIIKNLSAEKISKTSQEINPDASKQKISIYGWNGEVQKSTQIVALKEINGSSVNLYKGGKIEMKIIASSPVTYSLSTSKDCMQNQHKQILSAGNAKNDVINITPKENEVKSNNFLCLKLDNPQFIGTSNVNRIEANVEMFEYQ